MTDIKMSNEWQLTPAATGDAPLTDAAEGFLQTLKIEALTQEGELFYDEKFGWSLLDFMQAEETDLNKIEIESRIRRKMALHEEIIAESIEVMQIWEKETLRIQVRFRLTNEGEHTMLIDLNRVEVTVA